MEGRFTSLYPLTSHNPETTWIGPANYQETIWIYLYLQNVALYVHMAVDTPQWSIKGLLWQVTSRPRQAAMISCIQFHQVFLLILSRLFHSVKANTSNCVFLWVSLFCACVLWAYCMFWQWRKGTNETEVTFSSSRERLFPHSGPNTYWDSPAWSCAHP